MTYNLEKLRYINRLTQQQLADLMGVSKSYIGQVETGKSKLSDKANQKISDLINSKTLVKVDEEIPENQDNCFLITVRDGVQASMGYGVTVYDEKPTAVYHLSKKLARDIGVKPQNAEIIFAQGDSMLPTIEGGDSLLIDLSKKEIYDGKIYCVRIEGQLYAKRLQKLPPHKIKVVSDNKDKYDSFYVDFSENIDFDFEVLGEIRWWGRVAR